MNSIKNSIDTLKNKIPESVTLVAVSKTKPEELLMEAYEAGQRIFGENKVQELCSKYENLPKDIQWHMIGHLQKNKVKYIAPFVSLIHSVDSLSLAKEINKRAKQNDRVIDVLLQVRIAKEETKFGLLESEVSELLINQDFSSLENIRVVGLMGMASNSEDSSLVSEEFRSLSKFNESLKVSTKEMSGFSLSELSMGMSGDYQLAIEAGSTMIRVGSSIFGSRSYVV